MVIKKIHPPKPPKPPDRLQKYANVATPRQNKVGACSLALGLLDPQVGVGTWSLEQMTSDAPWNESIQFKCGTNRGRSLCTKSQSPSGLPWHIHG